MSYEAATQDNHVERERSATGRRSSEGKAMDKSTLKGLLVITGTMDATRASAEDPPEYKIQGVEQASLTPPVGVKTNVFIGGIPEGKYRRQQELARRPLTAADIPGETWHESFARLLLREDGVILLPGNEIPAGFLQRDGAVSWTRL